MRGNIFDIKRYAIHDGPGIRTTVFLKGCNLHCRWCHNPESQSLQPAVMVQVHRLGDKEFREESTVGYSVTTEELMAEILKDQVFFEESGGGVTFSGGEPLLQASFLLEILKLCKAHKIRTCIDTAGAVSCEILEEICRYTDLFLYDMKTAEEAKFTEFVGQGFYKVLENLGCIAGHGNRVIIRIPVIPGVNDTSDGQQALLDCLKQWPVLREVEFLPYHRTGADKYRRLGMTYEMGDLASMAERDLCEIKENFRRNGYTIL